MSISNSNHQTQSNKQKNERDIAKSQNLPRKPSNVNNKEFLNEVEEKLKAMRQKRLNRLSAFVDEQSKLSEVRSKQDKVDEGDMDQAIMSIQKEHTIPKQSFEAISEEMASDSVEKYDEGKSIEKQNAKNITASTIKFINKFTCVGVADIRSSVDYNNIDKDNLYLPRNNNLETKQKNREEINKKPAKLMSKFFQRNTINFPDNFSIDLDKTEQENFSKTLPHTNTYPVLSKTDYPEEKSKLIRAEQKKHIEKTDIKRNSLNDLPVSSSETIDDSFERFVKHPMTTFGKSTRKLSKIASDPLLDSCGLSDTEIDERKKQNNIFSQIKGKTTVGSSEVLYPVRDNRGLKPVAIKNGREEQTNFSQPKMKTVLGNSGSHHSVFVTSGLGFHKIDDDNHKEINVLQAKNNTASLHENSFLASSSEEQTNYTQTTALENSGSHHSIFRTHDSGFNEIGNETKIATANLPKNLVNLNSFAPSTNLQNNRTLERNIASETAQNKIKTLTLPINSGMSNKKVSREEKILKKLQRNWETINEILENDSDVDADEMEDFRNTVNNIKDFLLEYERKVKDLEHKKQPLTRYKEKLNNIIEKLNETVETINKFRGLRTDDDSIEIRNRLTSYADEVGTVPGLSEEKRVVISAIETCVKTFESKINRHEALLQNILKEQVDLIGSRHLPVIV